MKKLIYLVLPAFILVLASCSDNAIVNETNSEFKFQKELTISDAAGNSADLLIQANSQEILDAQNADVLIINTSTKDFTTSSSNLTNAVNSSEEIDNIEANEVFILVTNFKMNSDVTGFSVRSKLESSYAGNIETRASSKQYQYSYGSTGTIGACVSYASQTCNKEYLTTKLSRKKTSKSAFWGTIGTGVLPSVGDQWSKTQAGNYWYKLQIKAKKQCTGIAYYNFYWIT